MGPVNEDSVVSRAVLQTRPCPEMKAWLLAITVSQRWQLKGVRTLCPVEQAYAAYVESRSKHVGRLAWTFTVPYTKSSFNPHASVACGQVCRQPWRVLFFFLIMVKRPLLTLFPFIKPQVP